MQRAWSPGTRPCAKVSQPSNIKADFFEQFTDDWESRWKPSHAKKEDSKTTEEWAYVGEWAVEEPHVFKAIEQDKGLVVKNPAAHHAISAKFPKKVDNKKNTLVVQYEVKLQSKCQPALIVVSSTGADCAHRRSRMWWRLHEASPG